MNSKPDQILTFPDFETGTEKLANFQALKRLHELEYDKLLKYGYSLSLKALFPSALERQNVKLALKIFNPYVIQALLQFGTNINLSKDTADFINIILTWWRIVNVKTPHKGQRLNDIYQQPVVARNLSDPKLEFLNKMLNWLDVWKSGKFSHRLTSQTHNALSHTVYGMIEITKFCFEELNMKYILYGKFQTDLLENRFGKYRQLAGGQYNISVRQLYESEKRLRIQSLLSLKSQNFGTIHVTAFYEHNDLLQEEQTEYSFCPDISIDASDIDKVKCEMPVVTYLAGYCCYVV